MADLKNFFNPKSIAVIGASDHEEKVGGILMNKLLKYRGKIIPINPSHKEIFGKKCYASVLNVFESIDLAIIAVPAQFVAQSLEECGKKDIKNVIIISAGFSETGNREGENDLLNIAGRYNIRILGPNCFGVCNPFAKFDSTFAMTTPKKGDIAFISQSGALWSYMADLDIGFSGFVSLGNMADLEFPDFIEYFSKDKKTKSIVLYIEKLKNGGKFLEICRKSKKKIYAVKAGSSKEGSKAAFSHTGSLATDYEIYKGALKQAGVVLCDTLEEAFEKASGKKLAEEKQSKKFKLGKKVFIITNAGGAGALASDYFSSAKYKLAEVSDLKNPWDIIGTALSSDYKAALEKVDKEGADIDSVIVISTIQSMTDTENIAGVVSEFKKSSKKKVVALFLGEKSVRGALEMLKKEGIVCFGSLREFKESL